MTAELSHQLALLVETFRVLLIIWTMIVVIAGVFRERE